METALVSVSIVKKTALKPEEDDARSIQHLPSYKSLATRGPQFQRDVPVRVQEYTRRSTPNVMHFEVWHSKQTAWKLKVQL